MRNERRTVLATFMAVMFLVESQGLCDWAISSPSANTAFGINAAVSAAGTSTGMGQPFTGYVYKDFYESGGANKVVMNSATGTSAMMTGAWSITVNPPTVGMNARWTPTQDGAFVVTGADGGTANVEINIQ